MGQLIYSYFYKLYVKSGERDIGCYRASARSAMGHQIDQGRKEGNVLFNDALNTFYLRLYGVGHMVKDQSDS